jgi:hypothetical protein
MKKLKSQVVEQKDIPEKVRKELFSLYFRYFENTTESLFLDHMSHKDHVIVLRDMATEAIKGFATLKMLKVNVQGKEVYGIFTGDTIIDRRYWGEQELSSSFSYYAGSRAREFGEDVPYYWFLISKGYKTYRFLPVFTEKYWPCYKAEMPAWEKSVLDALAQSLYPKEYDAESGLITFRNRVGNLRPGVGDIPKGRLKDPDIDFFNQRNPDHLQGVELACITEMRPHNLKSVAKDYFLKGFMGEPYRSL